MAGKRRRVEAAGALTRLTTWIGRPLTPRGSRLLLDVHEAWEKAQAAAEEELGQETFAKLRSALPSPLKRRRT